MQERRTSSSGPAIPSWISRSLFASPWCDFPSVFFFRLHQSTGSILGFKGFGSLLDWRSTVACISPCISHAAILTEPLLYALIFHFLRWVSWSAPLFCRHQWSLDTRCRDSIGGHRSQPRERISRDFWWLACSSCCPKGIGVLDKAWYCRAKRIHDAAHIHTHTPHNLLAWMYLICTHTTST